MADILVFLDELPIYYVPRLYFPSFHAFCPHDPSPKKLTNNLKAIFTPPQRISKQLMSCCGLLLGFSDGADVAIWACARWTLYPIIAVSAVIVETQAL